MNRFLIAIAFCVFIGLNCLFSSSARADNVYVAIVAVSKIDAADGLSLQFVERDASVVQEAFAKDVKLIVLSEASGRKNEKLFPTAKNVRKQLANFFKGARECDSAMIYFSGHGMTGGDFIAAKSGDGSKSGGGSRKFPGASPRPQTDENDADSTYLMMKDSKVDDKDSWLSLKELRDILASLKTEKTFLMVDACRSGTQGATRSVEKYVDLQDLFLELKDDTGVPTFAACRGDEYGHNVTFDKNDVSFFTAWLSLGLKGGADADLDGFVTTTELVKYVGNASVLSKQLGWEKKGLDASVADDKGQSPVVVAPKDAKSFALPYENDYVKTYDRVVGELVNYLFCAAPVDRKGNCLPISVDFNYKKDLNGDRAADREDSLLSFAASSEALIKRALLKKGEDVGLEINVVASGDESDFTIDVGFSLDEENDENFFDVAVGIKSSGSMVKSEADGVVSQARFDPKQARDSFLESVREQSDVEFNFDPEEDVVFKVTTSDGKEVERRPVKAFDAYWVQLDPGDVYAVHVDVQTPKECKPNDNSQKDGVGMKVLVDGRDTCAPPTRTPKSKDDYVISPQRKIKFSIDPVRRGEDQEGAEAVDDSSVEATPVAVSEEDSQTNAPQATFASPRLKDARFWYIPYSGDKKGYTINGYQEKNGEDGAARSFTVVSIDPGDDDGKIEHDSSIGVVAFEFVVAELDLSRNPDAVVQTIPGDVVRSKTKLADKPRKEGESLRTICVRYTSLEQLKKHGIVE